MNKTLFITGFPGFLASELLKQLVDDYTEEITHIYLLVLQQEQQYAEEKLRYFLHKEGLNRELCSIVVGDITEDQLGLHTNLQDVTHVFHLAAIYDLAVPADIAERINVYGTKCVNEWVQTLPNLKRYIYFSTAYVSGKREGRIFEHELIEGQSFRNHYERTKYEAEILVEHMKQLIPTTIIRPGIVKGHSKTGQTIKFDGLYFMLNFYHSLQHLPVIPYLKAGYGASPEGNFIPSDYLLQATSYLAMHSIGEEKTYHLTDPNPANMMELQRMIMEHFLGKTPKGILPISVAKQLLQQRKLRQWLGVEVEAMDYFVYQSSYDATQTMKDLEGTGICCPNIEDTIPSMVSFYRKYRDDYTKHIQIN